MLPLAIVGFVLYDYLTCCANRWHRYPPNLSGSKPLQVFNDPKVPRSSGHQIVYLNEPHGVGNAILATLHIAITHRLDTSSSSTVGGYASPVVLGSKSICLVPFLPELCWILCGRDGFEFAESTESIVKALRSGRDVTLVPSGFSTIGTGGIVDWRKRKRFFQMLVDECDRRGVNGRAMVLQPVLWFQELGLYEWFPKPNRRGDSDEKKKKSITGMFETLRVKLSLPLGGFAIGWCLPFFILPKRGPNVCGMGREIKIGGGNKADVAGIKAQIKAEYDEAFVKCREVWNSKDMEGYVPWKIDENEWDMIIEDSKL